MGVNIHRTRHRKGTSTFNGVVQVYIINQVQWYIYIIIQSLNQGGLSVKTNMYKNVYKNVCHRIQVISEAQVKWPSNDIYIKTRIIETCIFPMINEAVKILEENKAQRPSDIDLVWLNGYGWPADKGGPMYYADMVGAVSILKKMEELGAENPAYAPAETLRKMAENGGKFTDIDTGGLKTTRS